MVPPNIQALVEALQSDDEQLSALITLNELEADIPYAFLLPLLTSSSDSVRRLTIETLARTTTSEDVGVIGEHLMPLLHDKNHSVRSATAATLGTLEYFPAVSTLSSLLHADESWIVRCSIAESLGYLHTSAVVPDLEQSLDDENESVRIYAARSIGLVAPVSFAHSLDRFIARQDNSFAILLELICAKYRIGGKDGFQQLLAILEQITDLDVLDRILSNINDFLTWKQPPTLKKDSAQFWTALEAIKARFPDREPTIKQIQFILDEVKSASPERIQDLYQVLANDEPSRKIAALKELESYRLSQAMPIILPLLHSPHDTLREQAAHTIGHLAPQGDVTVGSQLIVLLEDHNNLVQYEAAESLGLIHYAPAIDILREIMVSNSNWLVRIGVIEALDRFKERGLFADFQTTFERCEKIDTEEALLIQMSAAEALIHVATQYDVSILNQFLVTAKDRPSVRVILLSELYRLHVPGSIERLLELLTHITREVDILFALKCIFRLTEGNPPPLLQTDIPALLAVLSSVKEQSSSQNFFQATIRVDRLQKRLQRVRIGEIISPEEVEAFCC